MPNTMNYKKLIFISIFLYPLLITKTFASQATLDPVTLTSNNENDITQAKTNDEILLNFTAERSLSNVSVSILGRPATTTNISENNWRATTTVQQGDPVGAVKFSIDYQDDTPPNEAGQIVNVTDGSGVNLDTMAPVLQNIGVISDNSLDSSLAKAGETLTFTLTLYTPDTSGGGLITFQIGSTSGLTASLNTSDEKNTTYTGTYLVRDGENGPLQVTDLVFTDRVGNSLSGVTTPQVPSPTILVDTLAPTLVSTAISTNGNPGWAKGGQQVTFLVDFSEAVTGTINTPSTANKASTLIQDIDVTQTTSDTIVFQVEAGNNGVITPNNIDYSITDQAGNTTSINDLGIITGTPVVADTVFPTFNAVSITSNNSDPVRAKTNDTVTVSFQSSENITNVSGTLFGEPGIVTDEGGNDFTMALMTDGDELEGPATLTLRFQDLAGNIGVPISNTTDGTAVDFDRTDPMVLAVTVVSDNAYILDAPIYYAKAGDTITLSFTSNEPIQVPLGTVLGKVPTFSQVGNDWTASVDVVNTDQEGTVAIDLDIFDLAGNTNVSITTSTDGSSVFLDRTAPTIPTQITDLLGRSSENFKHRLKAQYSFSGQQDRQSDGVTAGSGLYQYEVYFKNDSNATNETALLSAETSSYIPSIPLPNDNPYHFQMNVIDKAGNISGETLLYAQKYTIGLYGSVTDSTGKPLENVTVQAIARYGEACDVGKEICSDHTDEDGQYSILLKKDRNYNVIYFDETHYLERKDIRINQADERQNANLAPIKSLRQVQTADKTVRVLTDLIYERDGQRYNTELLVSSLSGVIRLDTRRKERFFTIRSLSRITSLKSENPSVLVINNGDNTYTIKNAGLPLQTNSVERINETDLKSNVQEGVRKAHASGNSRIGVVYIPASGKAANRVAGQRRGEFALKAIDFLSDVKDPVEAAERAYQASLKQVQKINQGRAARVATYEDHKGREIFAGYLSGKLPVDRLKYRVPVRYGSRGLAPERSRQGLNRSAARKPLVRKRTAAAVDVKKENIGCIKHVRKKRDFRFGCGD